MRAVRADILEKQPNVRIVCEKIEDKKMLQNLIDAGFTYFQ
jgi:EAL domain-containing protein (putative c-di-GMP-specific phosphodiesterase class I)